MRYCRLLYSECKRLILCKATYLVIILSALSPLLGITNNWQFETKTNLYIGNLSLMLLFFTSVFFGLFTILQLHREKKFQTNVLTNAIISPLIFYVIKTVAILILSAITMAVIGILYFPYSYINMGDYFKLWDFLMMFIIFPIPAVAIAVLLGALCYGIFSSLSLSIIMFFTNILIVTSTYFAEDFIIHWINPYVPTMSDHYGNGQIYRIMIYSLFICGLFYLGTYIFSILCIRRYGKNIIGCILKNSKHFTLPIMSVIALVGSIMLYNNEPFFDNTPYDYEFSNGSYANTNDNLTTSNMHGVITPNFFFGTLKGDISCDIANKSSEDTILNMELNVGYKVKNISLNNMALDFVELHNDNLGAQDIEITIPKEAKGVLRIGFDGMPKFAQIYKTLLESPVINRDGIHLAYQDMFPFIDAENNGDVTCQITLPKDMSIISSNEVTLLSENVDDTNTWRLTSPYNGFNLKASDYVQEIIDSQQTPLLFQYHRHHQKIMDEVHSAKYMKNALDYCSDKYGSLQGSTGIEFTTEIIPLLQDNSFGMGGAVNSSGITISEGTFTEENLSDKNKGNNPSGVLVHEIVHLWWGTMRNFSYDDEIEWSSEGLTTYSTYRIIKDIHGEEYAKKHYVDVWESEAELLYNSFYYQNPEYLENLPENYKSNINLTMASILQYSVMPLKLLKAEQLVGGEDGFDALLREVYQATIPENEYGSQELSYDIFLEMIGLTKEDISLEECI